MRLATGTGGSLAGVAAPSQWGDSFNRANGPLGNGWTDGHDWDSGAFEPSGIYDGSLVCADPQARGGPYADYAETAVFPELYHGIGCAWRDFNTTTIRATYRWSGIWTPPAHTEGGPLLHVVPGTNEHGFGIWPTIVSTTAILVLATIANPPEDWGADIVNVVSFPHVEGTQRDLELRSNGTTVTTWIDGRQVIGPEAIPADLLGSTLHGFCFDTHVVQDLGDIPTTPVCYGVSYVT